MTRIGILTGGGDVPGLNPCIKTLVDGATARGWTAVGIRRGWAGLLEYDLDGVADQTRCVRTLRPADVRTIDRTGGTVLHTSRVNPGRVRAGALPPMLAGKFDGDGPYDCTPHVLQVVERLGIDWLVPIGGDDTLSYAKRLSDEGVQVVAVPKTMDNDVFGTDYCIGFSTAVSRSVEFVHALRTPAGSHERIAVVELFGRNCGETSLLAAYLSSVDRALICEVPFDPERLAELLLADKRANPSNYAMVTVSEGAIMLGGALAESGPEDPYGHRKLGGIGMITGQRLKQLTGQEILYEQVGYLMRAGVPDALDMMVAVNYANLALGLVEEGRPARMVCLRRGVYTSTPLATVGEGTKRVDVEALYDAEQYRPRVRHVADSPMFLY